MISTNDFRASGIPLSSVIFFCELPLLLNISSQYLRALVASSPGTVFEKMKFPKAIFTSPNGIRVWLVKDVEAWSLGIRRSDPFFRGLGATLIDRKDLADRLLGKVARSIDS